MMTDITQETRGTQVMTENELYQIGFPFQFASGLGPMNYSELVNRTMTSLF